MSDDRILLNLVLNQSTVQAVEGQVRNLVNRLNNQNINLNINSQNLNNITNRLNSIQQQLQRINSTPVNLGLTTQQQQYRLETERLRVNQALAVEHERTLQAMARQNRTLTVNRNLTHNINGEIQHTHENIRNANDATNDFVTGLGRGLQYILQYRIISEMLSHITEAYGELKNMDTEMVEIRKVTGATADEMGRLNENALKAAKTFGRSPSEYLSSVSSFAKAGYDSQSEALGELAMLAENVGDMDNELANQFLVSADAAWKLKGDVSELTRILDGFNELSNKTATTQEDLADGIRVAGSVFAQAGLSAQDYSALVGTAVAKTQESGAVAGRGLRTVLLNLRQIRGTDLETGEIIDEEKLAKSEKTLKEVGISIRETVDGVVELRNPMAVLEELATKWEHLSSVQQSAIQENLSGKRQSNIFTAVMENWSDVEKASEIYADSMGSAWRENEIYLDSWNAKLEKVRASWTSYIGGLQDTSTIKNALDTITSIIDALDSGVGRTATQVAVLVSALALLGRGFTWVSQLQIFQRLNLSLEIARITAAQFGLGAAVRTVTTTLLQQAAAFAASPLGMATIVLASITLINNAIEEHNRKLEETALKTSEVFDKAKADAQSMDDLINEYRELKISGDWDNSARERAKEIQEEIAKLVGDEANNLDLVNGKLEEQTAELYKQKVAKLPERQKAAFDNEQAQGAVLWSNVVSNTWLEDTDTFSDIEKSVIAKYNDIFDSVSYGDIGYVRSAYTLNFDNFQDFQSKYDRAKEMLQELYNEGLGETELYKGLNDYITSFDAKVQEWRDAYAEVKNLDAEEDIANILNSPEIGLGGYIDSLEEYKKAVETIRSIWGEEHDSAYLSVLLDTLSKQFPEYTEKVVDATETTIKTADSLETLNKQLDSIQDAYDAVKSAIEEYNKQGTLSVDTYQDLMELEPKYLNMLIDENGNLNLNTDAVNKNTAAYIENLGIKTAQNLIDKVTALSDEKEQIELLTGAVNENTEATWDNIAAQLSSISSVEVKDALTERINAIKAMTDAAKAGIGKGGLSKSVDNDKESLNSLKASIEAGELALQKFNDELERLSNLEDLTFEKDYVTKIQAVANKLNVTTKQAKGIRAEMERLMSISPANADEASEIASQVESLSKDYIEAQKNAIEFRREVTTATAEAYGAIAEHVADSSSEALEYIERLKKTTEEGSFLGSRYAQTFVPTGRNEALEKERRENAQLIAEEEYYQNTVLELKRKANEMALAETKETTAEIASTVSTANDELEAEQKETNENTTEELKTDNANKTMAIQSFFGWCKNQFNTFASWVKDNPIKAPEIDFSDTEKSLKNFNGGFSAKFANKGETDIVKAASRYAGTSYVYGGDSLSKGGLDCSGFVYNVLNDIGFKVGRTTADGYRSIGNEVEKSDMQYGDLLFFGKGNEATHIAIYAGDGKMWESIGDSNNTIWNPGKGVTLSNVNKRKDLMEVRRLETYASGTTSSNNEIALVGDDKEGKLNKIRPELIVGKDGAYLAGTHGAEFVNLNKGDQVIPYERTKEILSRSKNGVMPRYANGLGDLDIVNALPKLSVEQLEKVLSDSRWSGGIMNASHAQAIYDAQMETGLSALAILAIGALESGWGKSNIAKAKNNLWGYGAINNNPLGGAHSYTSMESAAKEYATELLKDYYNGYGAKTINQIGTGNNPSGVGYAYYDNGDINTSWATNVESIMESLYDIAGNTGFTNTTSTTTETSHTAEIERLIREVINRFDEEFISARNELAVIADEKQTENHLKYEEWLKNSPNDFSALESILSEGVENFDTFSKSVNELSIDSYQGQIGGLKGIKDSLVDLYNNAETATEKNAILEQIAVVDDNLSEINKNLISIYDSERERLANSVEAIGRRSEGEYGVGISYFEKNAEKLQNEIDNSEDALDKYEKRLVLADNYRKQSEKHLQAATDYHNQAETLRQDEEYKGIFDRYKIDEIFDATGEFNQLYYDYLSTMREDEVEKFRTVAETMQLCKKGYMENTEAAAELAEQADDVYSDAMLDKVEKYLELQDRLVDVLEYQIEMQNALTNGKEKMFSVLQSLREEQLAIEAQLRANMHLAEWLDKDTRALLFNEEDYAAEMKVIKSIQNEAEKLYRNYRNDIKNLREEDAWQEAGITAEYERQLDVLNERLEVAKQELGIAKKQTAYENALKERDTQVVMGNRMVNIHDPEDSYNKALELAEAEYQLHNTRLNNAESEEIRDMQRNTQALEYERDAINNRVEMINSMTDLERVALADFLGTMFEFNTMFETMRFANPFYITDTDNTRSVYGDIDTDMASHGYNFNHNYEAGIARLTEYLESGLIYEETAKVIKERLQQDHDYKTSTDANNSGYPLHNPNDPALDDTYVMRKYDDKPKSDEPLGEAPSYKLHDTVISGEGKVVMRDGTVLLPVSWDSILPGIKDFDINSIFSGSPVFNNMNPALARMQELASAISSHPIHQDQSVHYNVEHVEITNPVGTADELFRNLTTQLKSQHSITNNLR